MKKILITSLITSAIMIAVIVAAMVFMSKGKEVETGTGELDLLSDTGEKDEIYKGGSEELTIADQGGIVSFGDVSVKDIYNVKKSKAVAKKIDGLKKKQHYTFDSPLFIWNPYGTNQLSLYYYFRDEESTYIKYTIQVEDKSIPDFTRVLSNHTEGNLTRVHEYLLTGFVPGCQNYLVIRRYNSSGKLITKEYFDFYVDKLKENVATQLDYEDGKSAAEITSGLYCVCGYHAENKNTPKLIPLYDNSGVIRSAFPIGNYRTDRLEFADDAMIYSYSDNQIAVVSPLGQVLENYSLGKYKLHHDFIYNDYGQLWCLVTDTSAKTVRDCVISVEMKSGKVAKLVDFAQILSKVKNKAAKTDSTRPLNWIDLNSIVRIGSSDIIVSSRELSSIIRVNSVTSGNPKIGYIISDASIWKNTSYKKYLLTKGAYVHDKWYNLDGDTDGEELEEGVHNFTSQFGQNSVTYEQGRDLEEGQYYLTMFNNNYGEAKTLPTVKWGNFAGVGTKNKAAGNSYYYEYFVDEGSGYYGLKRSFQLPYSALGGNIFRNESNVVANSMKDRIFGEYDQTGKLIREYSLKAYRVYKYDMKNYWFY